MSTGRGFSLISLPLFNRTLIVILEICKNLINKYHMYMRNTYETKVVFKCLIENKIKNKVDSISVKTN